MRIINNDELEQTLDMYRRMDISSFDRLCHAVWDKHEVICSKTAELMHNALINNIGLTDCQANEAMSLYCTMLVAILYMLDDLLITTKPAN